MEKSQVIAVSQVSAAAWPSAHQSQAVERRKGRLASACLGWHSLSADNAVRSFRESEQSGLKQGFHYLSFLTVTRGQEKRFSCLIISNLEVQGVRHSQD